MKGNRKKIIHRERDAVVLMISQHQSIDVQAEEQSEEQNEEQSEEQSEELSKWGDIHNLQARTWGATVTWEIEKGRFRYAGEVKVGYPMTTPV